MALISLGEDVQNRGHVQLVSRQVALVLGLGHLLQLLQADGVVASGRQGDELPHPCGVLLVDGKVGAAEVTTVSFGTIDGFALNAEALAFD